jgi:hypothetical protein
MAILTTGTLFIAKFALRPDRKQEFVRAQKEIQDKYGAFMDAESHLVFYGWGRGENEWVAIESWKREETLNTLRSHPEFIENIKKLLSCCAAPIEISLYVGMDSERAQFDLYPTGISQFHPRLGDLHVTFVP